MDPRGDIISQLFFTGQIFTYDVSFLSVAAQAIFSFCAGNNWKKDLGYLLETADEPESHTDTVTILTSFFSNSTDLGIIFHAYSTETGLKKAICFRAPGVGGVSAREVFREMERQGVADQTGAYAHNGRPTNRAGHHTQYRRAAAEFARAERVHGVRLEDLEDAVDGAIREVDGEEGEEDEDE